MLYFSQSTLIMEFVMISLCIPTYNRLPHLKQCLISILDKFEDYPYEVIIIDGGSTDGTLEYLKDLNHDDIKLIEQGKLTGITKAYNASFKIAKGNYIFGGNDDTILIPKILIKACKLMDKEKQIGLIGVKVQEPRHRNLTGMSLHIEHGMLLGYFHIFRASVLKNEMNYFDESFRSYRTDDDSTLSALKLGYTLIFTKEIGMIHYRIHDDAINNARSININKARDEKERKYYQEKWMPLKKGIEEYLQHRPLKRYKSKFFRRICATIYYAEWLKKIVEKTNRISIIAYDLLLKQVVIFEDKNYSHLKDFYLPQKYQKEILNKIGENKQ